MAYTKTNWQNDQAPAINASNLNHIEDGIFNNDNNISNVNQTLGVNTNTWNSTTPYGEGDVVIYDNTIYRNISGTSTTTNPKDDTTNWDTITIFDTDSINNDLIDKTEFINNSLTNSDVEAYSCNYVNNAINPLQIYGAETKIGKWFNKDFYRQCFEITYTGGNVKILDFNYGQYVKSMKAMLVRTDGYCSEISWNSPTASANDFGILYVHYQNNAIMFNSSFTGTIYLTIEYTKN